MAYKIDRQRSDDSVETEPRSARLQSGDGARTRETQVDGQADHSHPAGEMYSDGENYASAMQYDENKSFYKDLWRKPHSGPGLVGYETERAGLEMCSDFHFAEYTIKGTFRNYAGGTPVANISELGYSLLGGPGACKRKS